MKPICAYPISTTNHLISHAMERGVTNFVSERDRAENEISAQINRFNRPRLDIRVIRGTSQLVVFDVAKIITHTEE